ncbi:MAG: zf-HC2 domain-containing protein [Gemmataceae bacterium]|nr:zf-HC2 domain-containing protein [Gemmataceae bacterium]
MYRCDDCNPLLIDYLYGLLDGPETQALRDHLAACPACRDALAQAEGKQDLFARAAQVYAQVPLFTAPRAEAEAPQEAPTPAADTVRTTAVETTPPEGVPASAPPAHAPAETGPATLPLPPAARRPVRRGRWLAAAAAVLLLASGAGYGLHVYRGGLDEHTARLAAVKKEVANVEARFAALRQEYDREKAGLLDQARAEYLAVQVIGPGSYQPSAPARFRIATQDVDGRPAPAKVTLRVLDDTVRPPRRIFETEADSTGEALVTLPTGLDVGQATLARLEVEARRGTTTQKVDPREPLFITPASQAVHLATSKGTYRIGEVLFCRALAVDRFSLTPAADGLPVQFALTDPRGQTVRRLTALTRHGVAAREFALTADLLEGAYTLQVSDGRTSTAGPRFLPETRRLTIVRTDAPQLQFDRPQYRPGDTGNAAFRARLTEKGAMPNQALIVEAELAGKPVPLPGAPPGMPLQLRTDATGKAAIPFRVPPTVSANGSLKVKVEVQDGIRNEKVVETVPVATAPPHASGIQARAVGVEFFPEGGDLVASVANRVYFRTRDAQGQPVAVEGVILNRQGKEVARGRTAITGVGTFELTPALGEAYRLQTPAPNRAGGVTVTPLPAVQAGGVTLSVADAVGKESEPLRLTVRDAHPGRSLVALASCRGRVVDQRVVTASKDGTAVELSPVTGTRGVVRVTVCATRGGQLVPLAERLVYRAPAEYLVLSVTDTAVRARQALSPGEHVRFKVRATTEKGEPTPSCVMVAVVDERVLREPKPQREHGPPVHFLLLKDVSHPEALEDADFLLTDTAEARRALDGFLATHGWRRFVPAEEGAAFADLADRDVRKQVRAGRPAVLVAGTRPDRLRERYEATWSARSQALQRQADTRRAELQQKKGELIEEARLAAGELARYEERPLAVARSAAAVVLVGAFGAGCLFLVLGAVRLLRRAQSPRASFALASVALGLSLGAILVAGGLPIPEAGREQALLAWLPQQAAPPPTPAGPAHDRQQDPRSEGATTARLFALAAEATERPTREQTATSQQARSGKKRPAGDQVRVAEGAFGGRGATQDSAYLQPDVARFAATRRPNTGSPMARLYQALQRFQTPHLQGGGVGGFSGQPAASPGPTGGLTPSLPIAPGGGVSPGKKDRGEAKKSDADRDRRHLLMEPAGDWGRGQGPVVREYAHRQAQGTFDFQDTLYWHPALVLPAGEAAIEFDLSSSLTTYRLLLYGHSASGRLGVHEMKLTTK